MKKIIEDDELMREWLYVKNDKLGLDPTELVIGSGKKAWWKCKDCGHEWFTQIYLRQKHNCPRCGAKKLGEELGKAKDSNRLTTIFPDVAKCWNYEKNGDLKPEDIVAGSPKKVW